MKPCPFCGCKRVSAARDHVVCEVCWANGPFASDKEEAIAKWNDRDDWESPELSRDD